MKPNGAGPNIPSSRGIRCGGYRVDANVKEFMPSPFIGIDKTTREKPVEV
jgi:hypothetical protein